ncbi:TIR domain-containing protein [Accumulibacter sp.]|uniref:TIR domain-containing protein n=1 Tax=Accumulibacter sp. TaxID=2053492 RepID=UPI0035AF0AC3
MNGLPILELQYVFVLSGFPRHTFVQPVEYTRLLVALRTPGRSIVVEGPSGIGKTTAVENAISEAGISDRVLSLSARKSDDLQIIHELPAQLPFGTVLIDDFHRLDDPSKHAIADLMKTLADEGAAHSKLIVLGITNAGQSLISFGKDLANRIEVIPFEANPEYKVEELLKKGEQALNVAINVAGDIARDSQGSFYLAQMLAYHACIRAQVLKTESRFRTTEESYESVKGHVMTMLSRSFHDTALAFARGTKLRREGRAPYLHLLYWLSQSKSWSINCEREADRHPQQRGSVSQVVTKGFLKDLIDSSDDIQRVLYFDSISGTLVVQDPQFVFYVRNISWPKFADEVGFVSLEFPSRYDFALSFAGSDRDIAEALFASLQEHELEVFYDRNEQHRILAADVEEYLAPIYTSDAQLVICILGPDYPKRVWTKFESDHFKQRFKTGEVIPIVLSTAPLGVFDSAAAVGHIAWDRSCDFKRQVETTTEVLVQKCRHLRVRARREAEPGAASDRPHKAAAVA